MERYGSEEMKGAVYPFDDKENDLVICWLMGVVLR
jgi:hypothetical protein